MEQKLLPSVRSHSSTRGLAELFAQVLNVCQKAALMNKFCKSIVTFYVLIKLKNPRHMNFFLSCLQSLF